MSTTTVTITTTRTTERRRTSYRKDPVTAALIFLVVATALLRPVDAAPVSQALGADFDSWWYNACGNHDVQKHHSRHAKSCAKLGDFVPSKSKQQVKSQMNIAQSNFQKDFLSINKTYAKVMSGFTTYTQPGFEWLPKFTKPGKHNRSKVILRNYHLDLQKYVVAVHYLSTLKLETEAEFQWQSTRVKLLTNLSNNMKTLLCEIETAVNATCQTLPERIPASFAYDHGLTKKTYGLTDLYVVDWGVLTRFRNFMKQSERLVTFLPKHNKGNKRKTNKQTQQKQNQNSNKKTIKPPKPHNKDKKSKSKSPT